MVDDDVDLCAYLKEWLRLSDYEVRVVHSGEECLEALAMMIPDAVCLDLNMPGMNGLQTLERIRTNHRLLPVIISTVQREVKSVVQAMKLGAYDYLVKPIDRHRLLKTIRNAVEWSQMSVRLVQLEREAEGRGHGEIVGKSAPILDLFRKIDRVAHADVSVMICGESGVGKELVAHAIHNGSGRKDGPFVALNCAAVPETLQESEVFGHERGAFTGASSRRIGKFEQAHQGTLFLDEIAELSLTLQAKLLRVLQNRQFQRVGGTKEIKADFRLVAATHRNLEKRVKSGLFREDLYFRVVVFDLRVPCLRERAEDIPLLVHKFISDYGSASGNHQAHLSSKAMAMLMEYPWPGNVRELQNAIQRSLLVARGGTILPSDLPRRIRQRVGQSKPPHIDLTDEFEATSSESSSANTTSHTTLPRTTLATIERMAIESAVKRHNGNVSEVSRELGIGRTTLYRKLKKYEIQ